MSLPINILLMAALVIKYIAYACQKQQIVYRPGLTRIAVQRVRRGCY